MNKPTAKPRAKRKAASLTSALDEALQAMATATVQEAPLPPPLPRKPKPAGSISPYPDLAMAIAMLQNRHNNVGGERKVLIEKWITQLQRIHAEITRLKKLEKLSASLTQPKQESLPL